MSSAAEAALMAGDVSSLSATELLAALNHMAPMESSSNSMASSFAAAPRSERVSDAVAEMRGLETLFAAAAPIDSQLGGAAAAAPSASQLLSAMRLRPECAAWIAPPSMASAVLPRVIGRLERHADRAMSPRTLLAHVELARAECAPLPGPRGGAAASPSRYDEEAQFWREWEQRVSQSVGGLSLGADDSGGGVSAQAAAVAAQLVQLVPVTAVAEPQVAAAHSRKVLEVQRIVLTMAALRDDIEGKRAVLGQSRDHLLADCEYQERRFAASLQRDHHTAGSELDEFADNLASLTQQVETVDANCRVMLRGGRLIARDAELLELQATQTTLRAELGAMGAVPAASLSQRHPVEAMRALAPAGEAASGDAPAEGSAGADEVAAPPEAASVEEQPAASDELLEARGRIGELQSALKALVLRTQAEMAEAQAVSTRGLAAAKSTARQADEAREASALACAQSVSILREQLAASDRRAADSAELASRRSYADPNESAERLGSSSTGAEPGTSNRRELLLRQGYQNMLLTVKQNCAEDASAARLAHLEAAQTQQHAHNEAMDALRAETAEAHSAAVSAWQADRVRQDSEVLAISAQVESLNASLEAREVSARAEVARAEESVRAAVSDELGNQHTAAVNKLQYDHALALAEATETGESRLLALQARSTGEIEALVSSLAAAESVREDLLQKLEQERARCAQVQLDSSAEIESVRSSTLSQIEAMRQQIMEQAVGARRSSPKARPARPARVATQAPAPAPVLENARLAEETRLKDLKTAAAIAAKRAQAVERQQEALRHERSIERRERSRNAAPRRAAKPPVVAAPAPTEQERPRQSAPRPRAVEASEASAAASPPPLGMYGSQTGSGEVDWQRTLHFNPARSERPEGHTRSASANARRVCISMPGGVSITPTGKIRPGNPNSYAKKLSRFA